MGSSVQFVGFDYMNEGTVAEIQRNVRALIETPEGTCPGDRSYGIDMEFVGMPPDVARNMAALSIIEKLETYEPRVALIEVTAENDAINGQLKNTYLIGPNEDYDEDDGEATA